MTACDTLVCIRGTCLVKRHRINAEMWAKLDKIKHTGECTDAGQCSKCAALFMFSNMGFLMRVWWLFLELESWKSQCDPYWIEAEESVDGAWHLWCSETKMKGQPSSSALQFGGTLIEVPQVIDALLCLLSFHVLNPTRILLFKLKYNISVEMMLCNNHHILHFILNRDVQFVQVYSCNSKKVFLTE